MDENKIALGGYIVSFLDSLKNAASITSTKQIHDMLVETQNGPYQVDIKIPDYNFVKAFHYKED